jgi:hypothetical protein
MEERKIMYSKLKEPQEQWRRMYQNRLNRLFKLVELNAPITVIGNKAHLVSLCFTSTWRARFFDWQMKRFPNWLLWLTSAAYRQVTRMKVDEPKLIFDPDEQDF